MSIKSLKARQILNSMGNPTLEVDLRTDKGLFRASVSCGYSPNEFSAQELRDNDLEHYHGKGVSTTVDNINFIIAPNLIAQNISVTEQEEIDLYLVELDGTERRTTFGSNAILAVSMAVCRAGAAEKGVPLYRHIGDLAGRQDLILPVPAFNILSSGGVIKELMILPTGATSFAEAMKMGSEVYHHLKDEIIARYGLAAAGGVSDQGSFCPPGLSEDDALELVDYAISMAGYNGKIEMALDIVASQIYDEITYTYDLDYRSQMEEDDPKRRKYTAYQLTKIYNEWIEDYPIVSIEDPYDKNDWKAWTKMTASTSIQMVADDLTGTNPKRIAEAFERKSCDCILLKKMTSVTEAIDAFCVARDLSWGTIVTHRSEETEDPFLADLVVGLSTGQIKTGAPCRSERVGKYNQLIRIEEELGEKAMFAGVHFRFPK